MASQREETKYYEQGGIKITSARAMFGNSTFALANITSVAAGTITGSTTFPVLLILVGIACGLLGFASRDYQFVCWGAGIVMVLVGIVIARSVTDSYVVKVGTSGAEQRAYTSSNKEEVQKIVAA